MYVHINVGSAKFRKGVLQEGKMYAAGSSMWSYQIFMPIKVSEIIELMKLNIWRPLSIVMLDQLSYEGGALGGQDVCCR
jgi:hypothetical protein